MRRAPSYGIRSRPAASNAGVRLTARTYGKARIGTYVGKADGHITVDSDAERLVAHILSVDPRVRSFKPQPFTVDLVAERLLFTREEVSEARRMRGGRTGDLEYTPDFATVQTDGLQRAYEVKLQGYEGDDRYWAKVERAGKSWRRTAIRYPRYLFHTMRPKTKRQCSASGVSGTTTTG